MQAQHVILNRKVANHALLQCNAAATNDTPMQAFECTKPSSTAVLHQGLLQGSANASLCMRQATFNVAPI